MTTQYTFASRVSSMILGLAITALASTAGAGCGGGESPPPDKGGGETGSSGGDTRPVTGATSSSAGGAPATTCKSISDCSLLTCVCYGVAGEQVRKCVNGKCGATCADFDGCS